MEYRKIIFNLKQPTKIVKFITNYTPSFGAVFSGFKYFALSAEHVISVTHRPRICYSPIYILQYTCLRYNMEI